MKILKYFALFIIPICIAIGCKKDQFGDTSFVATAASASNLSVMFNITHDNTGVVTVTPNGIGAVSYDIYFGDATTTPVSVAAGKSSVHTYSEGTYQVKIVAHDIKGGTTTLTQQLVVSYLAPQNLLVNVSTTNLSVNVSATAKYATFFKVYFGDSTNVTPVPFTNALASQVVTHNYLNAGTYVVTVVALSGGSETTKYLDTIKVGKQINIPVTFDDPSVNYTSSDFGGNVSTLVADPTNSNNHVMRAVKTVGAQTYAGTTLGTGLGFATPVPLTASSSKMTVMVYSPAAGLDVKLKLDNHSNPNNGLSVETDVKTTVSKQWETLTFDFSKPAAGTPAWSASNSYDLASIFFDFGNVGTGSTFYFDNVVLAPPTLKQLNLPVSFEDATIDYTMSDFGGNVSTLVVDPTNSSNHVMKSVKTAGAQVWAGTTVGTSLGFASQIPITASSSKMTVMVYSPAIGLDIKLKLDNHLNPNNGVSVETDTKTTVANQWETLTFDFSNPAAGTPAFSSSNVYDLASIFFDFGNPGTGSTFYFDNLKIAAGRLSQVNLPITFEAPTVDYTITDFGGNTSNLTVDPTNSSNHVIKSIKTAGAQTWAGTTMSTPLGLASAVPFTASRTKMSVSVYSPAVGLHIRLKVEDHTDPTKSVETEAISTVANQWETLTFDFSNQAAGTAALNLSYHLDMASIFFDFNNPGTGSIFYWDNVKFL